MASRVGHRIGMIGRPEFNTLVDGYNELATTQTVNIKTYGAVGNNIADDTAAFKAAIAAANRAGTNTTGGLQGFGGVVYVPAGIYKITASLDVPEGVSFQGDGMRTSVIIFTLNNTTDGLKLVYPAQYGRASFIRDLSFYGSGTRDKVRDVISLTRSGYTRVQNVTIGNAARYGIYQEDGIDIQIRDTVYTGNQSAGHYIADSTIGSINTTTSFHNCYFSNTITGPGANVTGTDVQFYSCVFESMGGGTDTTNGVGVRIRAGKAALYSPYFENNTWHDIDAGTVSDTHLTLINYGSINGPYVNANKIGIYCDKVKGGVISDANLSLYRRGLYLTSNCVYLKILVNPGPGRTGNTNGIGGIEWAGGILEKYPGFLSLYDPQYGDSIIVGENRISIGGGEPIAKSDTATKTWNAGTVADGAVASTTVTLTGALVGDIAYASYAGIGGQNFLISAHVQGSNTVRVVIENRTGAPVTFSDATLRVNIFRYFPIYRMP